MTRARRDKPQKCHCPIPSTNAQPSPLLTPPTSALKLQFLHHGDTTPAKADSRRINQHPPKHPLLSQLDKETQARGVIFACSALQELTEWTQGQGGLEPALALRVGGAGEDDAGYGGLEEEQFRERPGVGAPQLGGLQCRGGQSYLSAD
jgi:hypothetical protein